VKKYAICMEHNRKSAFAPTLSRAYVIRNDDGMTPLTFRDVSTNPIGQRELGERSVSQCEHGHHAIHIIRRENESVQSEKEFENDKGGALVAIDKGMVSRNAKGVRSRQSSTIGLSTGREILQPRQGRFEQALIADARGATVSTELSVMDCERVA
jgi:hypothetical protein